MRHHIITTVIILCFLILMGVLIVWVDGITGTTVEADLLPKTIHTTIRMIAGAVIACFYMELLDG